MDLCAFSVFNKKKKTNKQPSSLRMFLSSGKDVGPKDWKQFTLIVPAISIGNVGQLTADLLVSTLYMAKVGHLYDDSIIPVVGNNPFAVGDMAHDCQLMTGADVYESEQHHIVVVQLRSAVVQGKRQQFVDKVHSWIEQCGFCQVLILTSSSAHERRDSQLDGSQFRYVPSPKLEASDAVPEKLGWTKLERRPNSVYEYHSRPDHHRSPEELGEFVPQQKANGGQAGQGQADVAIDAVEEEVKRWCSDLYIPGGGYSKKLFQKCMHAGIPSAILLVFCSEGDNVLDAILLASQVNTWKKWVDVQKATEKPLTGFNQGWRIPSSWKLLFGSGLNQGLFQ